MIALLLTSVSINVGLSVQNRRLRAELAPPPFATGLLAPPLRLLDSHGRVVPVEYHDGDLPIVMYWFHPSCGWCEANLSNLKALAAQAGGKYRLLAVSAASPYELAEYSRREQLKFPIYTADESAARTYKLAGTPATVFVSGRGSFRNRWDGAYTPRVLTDIEKALGISLPGLIVAQKDGAQP